MINYYYTIYQFDHYISTYALFTYLYPELLIDYNNLGFNLGYIEGLMLPK